jgi:hypothetical protein
MNHATDGGDVVTGEPEFPARSKRIRLSSGCKTLAVCRHAEEPLMET